MITVDCQWRRRARRRDRPARFDGQSFGNDGHDFTLVLEIVVNRTAAIGDGEFGRTTQVNRANYFSTGWIKDSRAATVAIERKDVLGCGIVNDRIRVFRSSGAP